MGHALGLSNETRPGCTDERQDAIAAYTMSLAWYVTQDSKYAKKAIAYMNAWSGTIKAHTNSNAPLQTGWSAASWVKAAEIIKHTYTGWASAYVISSHVVRAPMSDRPAGTSQSLRTC